MKKIVIIGRVNEVDVEDSGSAQIGHVDLSSVTGADDGFFVRLHSWNEDNQEHPTMDALKGQLVRITIEVA